MYFDLDEEQIQFRNSLDGLLREHLPQEALIKRVEEATLDRELWIRLRDLGLFGVLVPQGVGDGMGLGLLTLAVAADRLSWYGAPVPAVENAFAAWLLARSHPDRAQAIMSGDCIAALALCESGGWQADDWQFPCRNEITGTKTSVLFAEDADLFLVGLESGHFGLVEADAPGVSIESFAAVDLTRPYGSVTFDATPAVIIDMPSGGAERLINGLLVMSAMSAHAAGAHSAVMAVDYAKMREQFGRPIGAFQALKHQLANMTAEIEPTRFLCWYAAHVWDLDAPNSARMASVAKAHVTDMAVKTARSAVEAHGGLGYSWEYPLHIFLKRAMADRSLYGLPQEHRERAARLADW